MDGQGYGQVHQVCCRPTHHASWVRAMPHRENKGPCPRKVCWELLVLYFRKTYWGLMMLHFQEDFRVMEADKSKRVVSIFLVVSLFEDALAEMAGGQHHRCAECAGTAYALPLNTI